MFTKSDFIDLNDLRIDLNNQILKYGIKSLSDSSDYDIGYMRAMCDVKNIVDKQRLYRRTFIPITEDKLKYISLRHGVKELLDSVELLSRSKRQESTKWKVCNVILNYAEELGIYKRG